MVFLLLIMVIVKALLNFISDKDWSRNDKKLTTLLMGFTHLQVVLGFVMYFFTKHYYNLLGNMKDPISRWLAIEHAVMMVLFAVLITVIHVTNKKPDKLNKNRRALILGLLAAAIGFAGIPLSRWF